MSQGGSRNRQPPRHWANPNDNLFLWFGGSVAVDAMRKNNATIWFDRAGSAYWGGTISAGTLSNSGRGTNTQAPVEIVVGPFGTNGNPITVANSYLFSRTGQRWGDQTGAITGTTTATLRLYRKIGAAPETLIATHPLTGSFNAYWDGENQPGQPPGTSGQTFINENMFGSWTFTDTAGGTGERTYRWAVEARTIRSVPGSSSTGDGINQTYSVVTSE